MSVPKRVLARAVDRNTVRRVARESWRAAHGPSGGFAVMLRLKRLPESIDAQPQGVRKRTWRADLDRLFAQALRRT